MGKNAVIIIASIIFTNNTERGINPLLLHSSHLSMNRIPVTSIGKTLAVIRGHRHLSSIHLTCYGVTHGYAVFVSDESQNFDTERITHGAHPL